MDDQLRKRVVIGSAVTVMIQLGKVITLGRQKSLEYILPGQQQTYIISEEHRKSDNPFCIHPKSFIGRALMGSYLNGTCDVNVGGVSVAELPLGAVSGTHMRLIIIDIQ